MSLLNCLGTTEALARIFSDDAVVRAMLEFEGALARSAAAAGAIPEAAARTISSVAREQSLDAAAIAEAAREGATPAIPLVKALKDRVRSIDAQSAVHVHVGATSQDVTDTALVLLLKAAYAPIAEDHQRLDRALRSLSERHASTVMIGRTLLQPATPITFGLKVAGWTSAIARSWRRLDEAWDRSLVIQFGGAAGTLASLGEYAPAIVEGTARELGLRAAAPWHTDRDRLGALVSACGLYVAALAKTARDVSLLMQAEVSEAAEPGGGSSTMPQKRNPSGCAVVLAAATRLPGLVSSYLTAMVQEHERAVGGGQAEWPLVSAAVQATGAAVAALAAAVAALDVDVERMRFNFDFTGGTVFAERAAMVLAPAVGRERARQLVVESIAKSRSSGVPFVLALRAAAKQEPAIPAALLDDLDVPERYLGQSEVIRKRLLDDRE